MVEDDVLAIIRVDPEWVLDWLVTALPITPPVRRRVLVPALAWHLGDAHIDGTELTVVFAIGIYTQPNLSALASALSAAPPADFGIVLTTSAAPPRPLRLPRGYEFLELREIARPEKDCLAIDKTKLVGWTKGLRKGLNKPAQLRAGRPSDAAISRAPHSEIAFCRSEDVSRKNTCRDSVASPESRSSCCQDN